MIYIYNISIYIYIGSLVYETSVLRTFKNCSYTTHQYTTHHTPLIIHHSSYTTHQYAAHYTPLINTPLIIHHSSYTTHHTPLINTPLIIHHSSYTTHQYAAHYTPLINTPLIIHHSSYTTHHTPLIIHHSSYTTHHTPLIIHHSSIRRSLYTTHQYTTHHTPLIIHHSSYTTHHTPLIIHHSSYTTHHAPIIIHHLSYTTYHTPLITPHSSYTTYHTPLIIHHSSYTTHHTPLVNRQSRFFWFFRILCRSSSVPWTSPPTQFRNPSNNIKRLICGSLCVHGPGFCRGKTFCDDVSVVATSPAQDHLWTPGGAHFGRREIRPVQEVSHQGRYNKNDSHQVSQLGQRVLDSSPAPQSPVPVQAGHG